MRRILSHISWRVRHEEAEGIKRSFVRTKRDQEMTFAYARQQKTKYNNPVSLAHRLTTLNPTDI